jgi:hypothetical protein
LFSLIIGSNVSVCIFKKGVKVWKYELKQFFFLLQRTTPDPEPAQYPSLREKWRRKETQKSHFSKIKLTILHLQKVTDQILHQAILLRHIPLEVHHLGEHVLIVVL